MYRRAGAGFWQRTRVRPGDVVASATSATGSRACALAGLRRSKLGATPGSDVTADREQPTIGFIVTDTDMRLLVVEAAPWELARRSCQSLPNLAHIIDRWAADGDRCSPGTTRWSAATRIPVRWRSDPDHPARKAVQADDIATIVSHLGTTGPPKECCSPRPDALHPGHATDHFRRQVALAADTDRHRLRPDGRGKPADLPATGSTPRKALLQPSTWGHSPRTVSANWISLPYCSPPFSPPSCCTSPGVGGFGTGMASEGGRAKAKLGKAALDTAGRWVSTG